MVDCIEKIPLVEIDLEDDRLSCSFPARFPPLIESMKRMGQLQPVTLIRGSEKLRILSGYRRALALDQLGRDQLEARILSDPPASEWERFLRNLEDNLATRKLNLFERARALQRTLVGFQQPDPPALLDISRQARVRDAWLALDRLQDPVKEFVLDRLLPEKTAFLLAALPEADGSRLVAEAEKLRLTAGQLRELIVLVPEIARREEESFHQVLERLLAVAQDLEAEGKPQARDRLMARLQKERLPDYSRLKKAIDACLGPVNASPGLRVQPPPALEGDVFQATLSFKNRQELVARTGRLLKLAESGNLDRLLELLDQ